MRLEQSHDLGVFRALEGMASRGHCLLSLPFQALRIADLARPSDTLPLRQGRVEPARIAAQEIRRMTLQQGGDVMNLSQLPGSRSLRLLRVANCRWHEQPEGQPLTAPHEIARRRLSVV